MPCAPPPQHRPVVRPRASLLARAPLRRREDRHGRPHRAGGGIDRAVLDAIAGELAALASVRRAARGGGVVGRHRARRPAAQARRAPEADGHAPGLRRGGAGAPSGCGRRPSRRRSGWWRRVPRTPTSPTGSASSTRAPLDALFARGAVPVINENDTVSVDEIAFGDNDSLSAQVANLARADVLVMLSVAPRPSMTPASASPSSPRATGPWTSSSERTRPRAAKGMVTKVRAARGSGAVGATSVIASGRLPGVLTKSLRGEDIGTVFEPRADATLVAEPLDRPHAPRAGTLVVDDGARKALVEGAGPSRRASVSAGSFRRGDPVDIATADGKAFARGLATYGRRAPSRCGAARRRRSPTCSDTTSARRPSTATTSSRSTGDPRRPRARHPRRRMVARHGHPASLQSFVVHRALSPAQSVTTRSSA